ncbi:XAC2610-related protein [Nubsella zeaxanthinifaciens]|uniref:XAC2610-related protein n=1 Tax=Nubsella zeaxanthinifaciens TaxID=392412 RepID=UPI003CFD7084
MKIQILTSLILTTLFSCGQPNEKKHSTSIKTDVLQTSVDKKEKGRLEKKRAIEEQNKADSLRLDKILQDALKFANENFDKNRFVKQYIVSTDSIDVGVEINSGFHFTNTTPHLIIRRSDPSAIYIDIYSKDDGKFKKVVSHEQWAMEYIDYTIQDINGDGLNDFVINWYGSTGCCLKAFSNVYLLRGDKKAFSENFKFINPTFSPKEKTIRGVCYGHPGETEMYKYKWNGEKVDTLEYVSYERNEKGKTGKIIISNHRPNGGKYQTLKVLNSVPNEYKKIKGYDWFTGK